VSELALVVAVLQVRVRISTLVVARRGLDAARRGGVGGGGARVGGARVVGLAREARFLGGGGGGGRR
jgi:hypothetical protein